MLSHEIHQRRCRQRAAEASDRDCSATRGLLAASPGVQGQTGFACVRKRTVQSLEMVCTDSTVCRIAYSRGGRRMTCAPRSPEAPDAWKSGSTDAEVDVALPVINAREKRSLMDFHTPNTRETACSYLLRFTSLHDHGRGIAVPCDEGGKVDVDSLTFRLRIAYLGAWALVGQDYSLPTVQRLGY
jgi:hypothetical protein